MTPREAIAIAIGAALVLAGTLALLRDDSRPPCVAGSVAALFTDCRRSR